MSSRCEYCDHKLCQRLKHGHLVGKLCKHGGKPVKVRVVESAYAKALRQTHSVNGTLGALVDECRGVSVEDWLGHEVSYDSENDADSMEPDVIDFGLF